MFSKRTDKLEIERTGECHKHTRNYITRICYFIEMVTPYVLCVQDVHDK